MSESSIQLIKALTNANGAPGFEDDVLAVIRENTPDSVSIEEDKIRNLYLRPQKQDPLKPLIMVEGHSDELGFMVQFLTENGMIRKGFPNDLRDLPLRFFISFGDEAHRPLVSNALRLIKSPL